MLPSNTNSVPTTCYLAKIRHEWFQTDTHVTVSIFIKKVDPASLKVEITSRNLSIRIQSPSIGTSETVLDFDLLLPVVSAESSYEVLSTKIEVKMKKESVGAKWTALEGDGNIDAMGSLASVSMTAPPAYPSSSKKKNDWNKLDKAVEEDKPEGDAALNALFQQIYRDASEDTRRAMMKSYVESNGTCLSTNWKEVGSKPVAVTPPSGMVAKKFEF
ncbi:Cochaperone protein, variant 2 [Batrachochytrium dendrobatidis]